MGAATSGNTKAAIPAAMANKIPIISGSATADDITMDSDGNIREYVFKTCFSDSYQGIVMAEFATNDLGIKKVAILADSTSDYAKGLSKSFKETFEKYGGKILIEEAYKSKDTDFKAVLTSIKSVNPDAIFIPGYYEEVGLIVRQARELGLDVPILGGDGYESPKFAEISGKEAANNVFYSNHYSPMDDSEEVVGFRERFKKKYNKEPNGFNALGYDLAYLLKDALERAEEANPEKLKKALESTKDFKGVTGTITIDENHNPIKSTTIIELKDGVPVFLKKLDPNLITAIAVSLFIEYTMMFFVKPDSRTFPKVLSNNKVDLLGGEVLLDIKNIYIILVTIVLMILLQYIVNKTKIGKAMRAVALDKDAAQLMGVDIDKTISFTFLIGSALAGAAGVLVEVYYNTINPLMGTTPGLKAFISAVLGGIGIIPGAVFGGFFLGMVETLVSAYGNSIFKDAVAFSILIIVLLVKPDGLLGKAVKEKV